MKILVVIPYGKSGAGVTISAVNFCNEMVKNGNDVYILDLSNENNFIHLISRDVVIGKIDGIAHLWNIGVDLVKKQRGIRKLLYLLLGAFKKLTIRSGLWFRLIFKKYKQFGKFDVAIAFRQCAPCYSFVLNKVDANKKIGFVHGELTHMGNIKSWQKYMKHFHKVAYVSNAVKEQFVSAYPELKNNACTIYNMIDVERVIEYSKEQNPIVFNKNTVNIVTVSRIDNDFKRIDWIPKICKKLKSNCKNKFRWYIVGDGADFDSVNKLVMDECVNDVCMLVGKFENPYSIMKDASFSVLLSKSESYGMVVSESIILNVPVVCTRYPALKEIMNDGVNGLIIDSNFDSVYENVFNMIEHKERIMMLKNNMKVFTNYDALAYKQFLEAVN